MAALSPGKALLLRNRPNRDSPSLEQRLEKWPRLRSWMRNQEHPMTNRQSFRLILAIAALVTAIGCARAPLADALVVGIDVGLILGVVLALLGHIRVVPTVTAADSPSVPVRAAPRRRDAFFDPLYVEPGTGILPAHMQHALNELL